MPSWAGGFKGLTCEAVPHIHDGNRQVQTAPSLPFTQQSPFPLLLQTSPLQVILTWCSPPPQRCILPNKFRAGFTTECSQLLEGGASYLDSTYEGNIAFVGSCVKETWHLWGLVLLLSLAVLVFAPADGEQWARGSLCILNCHGKVWDGSP